jgi:hypothetical protein
VTDSISARLEALRARAQSPAALPAADPLDQLRQDMRTLFGFFRLGELSPLEARTQWNDAGSAIQHRLDDPDWMAGLYAHFRELAAGYEASVARSERIRAEVRAEKGKSA